MSNEELPIRLDERVNGLIKNFDDFRTEVNDKFDALTLEIRTFSQQMGALLALQKQMNDFAKELKDVKMLQDEHSNFIIALKSKIAVIVVVLAVAYELLRWFIDLVITYVKHR